MKKIFIDGLGLVDGHFSGVGQYILGILRGIDECIAEAYLENTEVPSVIVVIPRDTVKKFESFKFKHIQYKKYPLPFRYMAALWHRNMLPPLDLWCGRGVYIFPRFVSMRLLFSKSANVVYDLSFEHYRQFSDEKNAEFLSQGVARTVKQSRKVITISENSRRELIDFYKLPKDDVVVATPATDPHIMYRRSKKEVQKVKEKYGINGDYILALSNLEPRKNLEALIDVYSRLPKSIIKNTSLLLVGVNGWKTDALFDDIIRKVEAGAKIIRPTSYVTDADKPAIISGAKLLVYPSHYEGFGMPPLEALACGVPVISANNSSLPEVVKGAGEMVNSDNRDELFSAVQKALENIELLTENTRESGPKRAEKFSWEKSGDVFLEIAKELMK